MITALDHIAIAVPSIEEARTFYENLGLSVAGIEEVEHEGVRVGMIPCGGSRIELLEPLSSDSPVARFLERRRRAGRTLRAGGVAAVSWSLPCSIWAAGVGWSRAAGPAS